MHRLETHWCLSVSVRLTKVCRQIINELTLTNLKLCLNCFIVGLLIIMVLSNFYVFSLYFMKRYLYTVLTTNYLYCTLLWLDEVSAVIGQFDINQQQIHHFEEEESLCLLGKLVSFCTYNKQFVCLWTSDLNHLMHLQFY